MLRPSMLTGTIQDAIHITSQFTIISVQDRNNLIIYGMLKGLK